jgi:hypothetical protein
MSFRAHVHDLATGCFLLRFIVEARDLHEAENTAIAKAAQAMRAHPREMEVRQLHQCFARPSPHIEGPSGVANAVGA